MRLRLWDYHNKLRQLFALYGHLELLYPEEDVPELLKNPSDFMDRLEREHRPLKTDLIACSLDLMYFWVLSAARTPRAEKDIAGTLRGGTPGSSPLADGTGAGKKRLPALCRRLAGRDFARALSFYLDRHRDYLKDMERLLASRQEG